MLRICSLLVLLAVAGAASAEISGRLRVIDGDTFDLGGTRVRLFGVDAPEQDQTCERDGVTWGCGAWVTAEVRKRFDGKRARCTGIETDRYGREVARCEVGGQDLGHVLVSEGLAFAFRRYSMEYDLDEKGAVVAGRGIHGSVVERPAEYRAEKRAAVLPQIAPSQCRIKGNISGSGKIYHVPGQENYDDTRIDPKKGERWFCTEAEAKAAGWRKARR